MHYINRHRVFSITAHMACALALFALALFSLNLPARARAYVNLTTSVDAAALADAIVGSNSNIVLTGTPVLSVGNSTQSSGTFTATVGSYFELDRGVILSTRNISSRNFGHGSGINDNSTNEFNIVTLTFSFIPKAGVSTVLFNSVFASDEYDGFNRSIFSGRIHRYNDNFTIMLSGGSYSNVNVATIPGTTSKVSILTLNSRTNSSYYRNNLGVSGNPLVDDVRYYGLSTLLTHTLTVVPGTTYTATIRIADGGGASTESSVFIGTMPNIHLDISRLEQSIDSRVTWYKGTLPSTFIINEPEIRGENMRGENIGGTNSTGRHPTFASATITLTNPQAGDLLSVIEPLPGGITASAYNPATGVLTLSGAGYAFSYQDALSLARYSGTISSPARIIKVVVYGTPIASNPPLFTNTATVTIDMVDLHIDTVFVTQPTRNNGVQLNDEITYYYNVFNTGTVPISDVWVQDMHGSPPVQAPVTNGILIMPGPMGAAASTDYSPNDGRWNMLAPGAGVGFRYVHRVTQAEIDRG